MSETINVLIVDDDKEIRDMLMNMVEDWVDNSDLDDDIVVDFRLYSNGRDMITDVEILNSKEDWTPHLCCVDYQMDCGNGKYVINKLNIIYPEKEFNILMITAWSNSSDIDCIKNNCIVVDKVDPVAVETAIQLELENFIVTAIA